MFVHLHVHSQYSLLEATCQFKPLVKKAKEYGMPAVAITDYGNMFGAVEFYLTAKSEGVQPIIGLEVYLAPGSRFEKNHQQPNRRLVLLAKSYKGYQNLCQISTIGYQEGFYYRPRVDYEVLEKWNEDLVALSGGLMGEVPWTFQNQGEEAAIEVIKRLNSIYPDFYLELNRQGLKEWEAVNQFLIKASRQLSIPLVATNNVHYLEQGDQIAQEVLICIGSNKTLQDESRYRLGSDQFYFKSPQQMKELFKDVPEALENTLKIAEMCHMEFRLKDDQGRPIYHLPSYPTKGGRSLKEEIKDLSYQGLKKRFKEMEERGEEVGEEKKAKYFQRLDYELQIIDQMGFNGYFLIVQDFISWAKSQGIPVGPGRGSGAGSLVAFSLRITDLDPMPYNLIFERFLNPERISMPDFDIDFCQENRGRVIEYVTQKYGRESVSQIITYGKLQARAAIRDVGRVMGMTYSEVDVVAKLVPDRLGITLKEAIEEEPRLQEMMENDPKIASLMDLSLRIEGLVRHAGIHAAGVIIADGKIVSLAPLYKGVEGENVVQYDMKHAEKIGLIKFDFLGLKTLTHIHEALRLIEKNQGKKIRTTDISLKDEGIYKLMGKGDTAGIFQFESEGITDLIVKAQPSCFEDIVAINALYRPGPMDMIPDYLKRKKGEVQVEYVFPELEPILKETYGIVVYQEQVQLIASKIANYSLGEADMLRRAMGKKIASVMAEQKERFLKGAKENHYDIKKAEELFDTMAEFAKYGFNKSHAAAYCVVAAQTAYLKFYYPVEFFAALLSTEMSDTDKIVKYVKDAQKHDIEVLPPDINKSDYKFSVDGKKIFFALGAIKGVGQAAVESIIEARLQQPQGRFQSLEDFFENIDLRKVNKKTLECLIKAGAFDSFGIHRAQLMEGYSYYVDWAERKRKEKETGQVSLFAMDESLAEAERVQIPEVNPWTRSLALYYEKEVLGFYLSDHPLRGVDRLIKPWVSCDIQGLQNFSQDSSVSVFGLLSQFKEIITKKGTRMAFAKLEDLTGAVELVIFPDTFATYESVLKSEEPLLVSGKLEKKESGCKILVQKVQRFEELLKRSKKLVVCLKDNDEGKLLKLRDLLASFPGDTPLAFNLDLEDVSKKVSMGVQGQGVELSAKFLESAHELFGEAFHLEV
ncbi:MAG: DNA polymerase III subunit alpha [Bdellovibrio sp.]|nr:MAG: DNA polymerase III subunit alpha [Bdellovibrio sp.]